MSILKDWCTQVYWNCLLIIQQKLEMGLYICQLGVIQQLDYKLFVKVSDIKNDPQQMICWHGNMNSSSTTAEGIVSYQGTCREGMRQ